MLRILGIDPSLRCTGYAVIQMDGRNPRSLTYGKIANPASLKQSECLAAIYRKLFAIIDEFQPHSVAVEGVIYVQNRRTSIALGAARGAALVATAERNIPVYEYPARSVKKASTGFGRAAKNQVGFMMRTLFQLRETPSPDEADALAIALTHLQALQSPRFSGVPL